MHSIGLGLAALSFGTVGWVFLVQAPWLTKTLGRDRFVPIQMSLMKPLLAVTGVASLAMLAVSRGHWHLVLAGSSLGASSLTFLVLGKALRAGAASLREKLDDDASHSATRFVGDGGGETTKVWHRVLGLLMVTVLATQGAWLLIFPAAEAHEHANGKPTAPTTAIVRHHATPETVETVQALRSAVEQALSAPPRDGAALSASLQQQFQSIFQKCKMEGAAHESLHEYLAPVAPELESLSVARDQSAVEVSLKRLKGQLDSWSSRFE